MVHHCVCLLSSFSSLQLQAVIGNVQGRVRGLRPAARIGWEFAIQDEKREWEPICTRFAAHLQPFEFCKNSSGAAKPQEM